MLVVNIPRLGSEPCFVTKSVRFGRTELLFFFLCSKSRDLGPEHGFRACSFENKRNKLDFHIFGCKNVPLLQLFQVAKTCPGRRPDQPGST